MKMNKLYSTHIPLNKVQKLLLTVGSGIGGIIDPLRHDLVANFGETTGQRALKRIYELMHNDSEGREVLVNKPRLHTSRIDYGKLSEMNPNSLGFHYSQFYYNNQVSPDTRRVVQFVDDPELAYVMQRYRELHDLVHTILNLPTTIQGEVIIKAFEGVQTQLPLCVLGGIFGPLNLNAREKLEYITRDLPWAIRAASRCKFLMNIYFEKRFEQDIDDLRHELNISLIPR